MHTSTLNTWSCLRNKRVCTLEKLCFCPVWALLPWGCRKNWRWLWFLVPGPSVSAQQPALPSLFVNRLISDTVGHRPQWRLGHTVLVCCLLPGSAAESFSNCKLDSTLMPCRQWCSGGHSREPRKVQSKHTRTRVWLGGGGEGGCCH